MGSSLNVEYGYSLKWAKYNAYWNIKRGSGKITFYLPRLWAHACDNSTFKEHDFPDECEENFIQDLIFADLTERICLERAHEKIRMKGRTRCEPNCCVRRAALKMYDPSPENWVWVDHNCPVNAIEAGA